MTNIDTFRFPCRSSVLTRVHLGLQPAQCTVCCFPVNKPRTELTSSSNATIKLDVRIWIGPTVRSGSRGVHTLRAASCAVCCRKKANEPPSASPSSPSRGLFTPPPLHTHALPRSLNAHAEHITVHVRAVGSVERARSQRHARTHARAHIPARAADTVCEQTAGGEEEEEATDCCRREEAAAASSSHNDLHKETPHLASACRNAPLRRTPPFDVVRHDEPPLNQSPRGFAVATAPPRPPVPALTDCTSTRRALPRDRRHAYSTCGALLYVAMPTNAGWAHNKCTFCSRCVSGAVIDFECSFP